MEAVTLGIAAVAVLVTVCGRPITGLVAYLVVLMAYPDFLRVSLGTVDISASRIVITTLLLKCMATPGLVARFRWRRLDVLVALSMATFAGTLLLTTPMESWLENRGGFVMDTFFAYIVVRLIVVDRAAFLTVSKAVAVVVVPLAALAMFESATGWSPYAELGKYCPWAPNRGSEHQMRRGFYRAEGPYGETIMLGLYFTAMLPLVWALRNEPPPWRLYARVAAIACIGGLASTLSSGPYTAMIVTLACMSLERAKHLVKPLLICVISLCVIIEIVSNRHFYDVLSDRLALNSTTAWYRSELFEVAIHQLPNYWLVGYGLTDPGWGPLIDGRDKTDGVNDYVVHAMVYGLPGLFAYLAVQIAAITATVRGYRTARTPWGKSCNWGLTSALIGLMVSFWTVSVFTQMVSVYYLLIGLMGAAGEMCRQPTVSRKRAPSARPLQRVGPARPGVVQ